MKSTSDKKQCVTCGRDFARFRTESRPLFRSRKWCSESCKDLDPSRVIRYCEWCSKMIDKGATPPSVYNVKRYCGHSCAAKGRMQKEEVHGPR